MATKSLKHLRLCRWLAAHGQLEAAREVALRLHGTSSDALLGRAHTGSTDSEPDPAPTKQALSRLAEPQLRRQLVLGMLLGLGSTRNALQPALRSSSMQRCKWPCPGCNARFCCVVCASYWQENMQCSSAGSTRLATNAGGSRLSQGVRRRGPAGAAAGCGHQHGHVRCPCSPWMLCAAAAQSAWSLWVCGHMRLTGRCVWHRVAASCLLKLMLQADAWVSAKSARTSPSLLHFSSGCWCILQLLQLSLLSGSLKLLAPTASCACRYFTPSILQLAGVGSKAQCSSRGPAASRRERAWHRRLTCLCGALWAQVRPDRLPAANACRVGTACRRVHEHHAKLQGLLIDELSLP